ncbi:hypothetical protein G6O69_32375 [Pseudenhygromyxa sp. WMMC2535]|uniref:hypothetical protein n=1 Tax=Pseudenhygromyxa sp. WMMC2535 TaxID=2712867 RepID=UPI0015571EFA|nr:hypothetical protein [Pseudenhygromyxa sp. WMMC2535]NVB42565.1 hypothetical protein [Pseudenhygromyxa sp. WMMC2535]
MSINADVSGSFQRPTLVDYLIVAELQSLDLGLRLWIGALEVGLVGLRDGQVTHAELPGASGDPALTLLARLPVRITTELWSTELHTVRSPWRELVDESIWGASPGRAQRLEAIRSELQELFSEPKQRLIEEIDPVEVQEDHALTRARRLATELLDWAAVEAYLGGDRERARRLLGQREQLLPGDLLCAANLERLRLRLLEDEITASVGDSDQ